jgi:hypothetical protein
MSLWEYWTTFGQKLNASHRGSSTGLPCVSGNSPPMWRNLNWLSEERKIERKTRNEAANGSGKCDEAEESYA